MKQERLEWLSQFRGLDNDVINAIAPQNWYQTNQRTMKKNIETVIGGRFKQGMSQTIKRANNPIKLRTLWHKKIDWEAF